MKVVVTGGSGKVGRAVVRHLLDLGHDVKNVDLVEPAEKACPTIQADLSRLAETFEVLRDAEAVVHLAAIVPGAASEETTFRVNVESTFNIFMAATSLRLDRIVWASSEAVYGVPFGTDLPAFVPIDESHPLLPETSYALSKVLGEEMARQFSRRTGIPIIGLRLSFVMEPEDYRSFPSYWKDASERKWNFWGYVDSRDVAQAVGAALSRPLPGCSCLNLAAADTVMDRPSGELMAAAFPSVKLNRPLEAYESLLSVERARRLLGYEPAHSWRSHL